MYITNKEYCPRCMREKEPNEVCPHCGYIEGKEKREPWVLETGTILADRYQLCMKIGQGGSGITYSAMDETLNVPVAIKEYFPKSYVYRNVEMSDEVQVNEDSESIFADGLRRFIRESQSMTALESVPGVVHIRDYFSENGTAYIVMDFVRGVTFGQYVAEHHPKIGELKKMLRGPIDALIAVHRAGILHRDINPSNLIVEEDGNVRLIDFGSAGISDNKKGTSIYVSDGYAAPELYKPNMMQGPWIDVYGMAAVFYGALTMQQPQDALQREHQDQITWENLDIGKSDRKVLTKAFALRPENRTGSMEEFRARLYHLPLPEEVLARKRLIKKSIGIFTFVLLFTVAILINFLHGLPVGNGLFCTLDFRGWHVVNADHNVNSEMCLPESILGIPVKSVGKYAFSGNDSIISLEIPGTITTVEAGAFQSCRNLQSLRLDEGIERIESSAFYDCEALFETYLPQTLSYVSANAFDNCSDRLFLWGERGGFAETYARSLSLPFASEAEFVTEENETGLTLVSWDISAGIGTVLRFPDKIGGKYITVVNNLYRAFYPNENELSQVTELYFPSHMEILENWNYHPSKYLFPALQSVDFGKCAISIEGDFANTPLQQVSFPATLREIGDNMFADTTALREINLPEGLLKIGDNAFAGSGLENLVLPNTLQYYGTYCFCGCEQLQSAYVVGGTTSYAERLVPFYAFSGCISLKNLTIAEGVETIYGYAFSDCDALEYCYCPESVTEIDSYSFGDNISLKAIYIENKDAHIEGGAFGGANPNMVIMGHGGSTAETYAMEYSYEFQNVDTWLPVVSGELTGEGISATVTVNVVADADSDVVFPSFYMGKPITDLYAANTCEQKIHHAVLPLFLENTANDGENANYGIPNVQSLSISGKVIGGFKGENYPLLTSVEIRRGASELAASAFKGCSCLQSVSLPMGLEKIGDCAFDYCAALDEISIPETVSTLGYGCFAYTKLQSVTTPSPLLSNGSECFAGSGVMEAVVSNLPVASSGLFTDCTELERVTIKDILHNRNEAAWASDFTGCTSLKEVIFYTDNYDVYEENPFADCPDVTIYAPSGGKIEEMARRFELTFVEIDP